MSEIKIGIHPVHRRLAELCMKHSNLCDLYKNISAAEFVEFGQCLKLNADLVCKLDELKQLSFVAHLANDEEWKEELGEKIKQLEASFSK
ncbi:hypothetical protein M5W78_00675 [Paenibacillus larvae]|uniref:DUF7667 family protein n=1 Tax=Paenibacillus larvae TaxID=1464 RepID=UPI00227E2DDA|nr:hypothetical protein [Paenibacillus larvae]MCY9508546.1 hypothetical protein [Paenibacillus larvae]